MSYIHEMTTSTIWNEFPTFIVDNVTELLFVDSTAVVAGSDNCSDPQEEEQETQRERHIFRYHLNVLEKANGDYEHSGE